MRRNAALTDRALRMQAMTGGPKYQEWKFAKPIQLNQLTSVICVYPCLCKYHGYGVIGALDLAELDQDTRDIGISVTARAREVFE
jgi:hypothetical protein